MKKIILLLSGLPFLTFTNQAQTAVTDIDGNVYNTVTIGTQTWMSENLKTTKYNDGTAIPNISDSISWSNLTTNAYCDYNNIPNNSITYGRNYNWYAATDFRNICPTSWHVPSDGEWNILGSYLDNTVDSTAIGWEGISVGNQLKESGTIHWAIGSNGTNSSNFTALPGGGRRADGSFAGIGIQGAWWTSTDYEDFFGETKVWFRSLYYESFGVFRFYDHKTYGFSIRCVKDSQTTQIKDKSIDNNIQIYPNPATEKLTIAYNEKQNINLQIYNTIGECVMQKQLANNTNEIDISSLAKGIYVVRITGTNGTFQQKLIKE